MKIQLIDFGGKSPERAHANDAGADVFSPECFTVVPGQVNKIPLGFGLRIPDGYAGYIFPRSGLNKSEIEIDSNLDMQISVLSHEGALEINQLSATSRLTLPADYRFRSTKKGIATHIYYERQGKKVDDFSDAEADNYIELNGIKSELVIVEAEV